MRAPGRNGNTRTAAQERYRCGFYDAKHGRPWAGMDYSPAKREDYARGYDYGKGAKARESILRRKAGE